jgi:hypothetical protein
MARASVSQMHTTIYVLCEIRERYVWACHGGCIEARLVDQRVAEAPGRQAGVSHDYSGVACCSM